jgi:hypothetical protein
MVTRERRLLEQIIKEWAQSHTSDFTVADYTATEQGMENTSGYFTWVIQEGDCTINLLSLANSIETWMESRRKREYPDGMLCQKCKTFYEFAEPNQDDGSMICYSCRHNPYR